MLSTIPAPCLHIVAACLDTVGSPFLAAAELSVDMHPLQFHLEFLVSDVMIRLSSYHITYPEKIESPDLRTRNLAEPNTCQLKPNLLPRPVGEFA